MKNIGRNINALLILDFLYGAIALFLSWSSNLHGFKLFPPVLYFMVGIAFIVAGIGLKKRQEWARIAHYPLSLLVIAGNLIGVAYAILVWIFISKKEVVQYFRKR